MKYTEEERKRIIQARIDKEKARESTINYVFIVEILISIIVFVFLIVALSH